MMADYETIMKALRNAHAAGDTAAAQRLAQMAKEARGQAQAAPAPQVQADPAQPMSRSRDLIEQSMREPDSAKAKALMDAASAAAVEDGETPDGVAFNPGTGRLEDLSSPISPYAQQGGVRAAAQGLGQGVSFGGMDEAVSGAYGLIGPGSFGQNRAWADAVMDEELRRARDQHPYITGGAEIAGGLASGLAATGGIPLARTIPGRIGQAMGIGAGSGAAYGGLSAEGGAAERVKGMAVGAGLGGILGAASVPAEIGLRAAGSTAVNALRNISGAVKPDRVETALAQALAASGRSADDIRQAIQQSGADDQAVFALADALGQPGQRALSGVARSGGTARRIVSDSLEGRQVGQGERISQYLSEALGVDSTAAARRAALTAERGNVANAAYDAARRNAGPVDVSGALAAIDDRIGPMQGSGVKGDGIDAKLSSYRNRLAARNPGTANPRGGSGLAADGYDATPTGVELSDFDRVLGVKQAIQDDIGAAVRAGRNNEARELGRVVQELDAALESASDAYRAANDGFRDASRVIDQIDAGVNAARPSTRAADNVDQYSGLTPQQQAAFRSGYADRLLGRVENAAEGVNKARQFTSGKSVEELAAMARDPKRLARVLDRENIMFETRRQAVGGSQTADNLADMNAIGAIAQRGFNPMNWARDAATWVGNMARGQNDATRTALADALLSTGDKASENIGRALARGEKLNAEQQQALQIILYLQGGGAAQLAK